MSVLGEWFKVSHYEEINKLNKKECKKIMDDIDSLLK